MLLADSIRNTMSSNVETRVDGNDKVLVVALLRVTADASSIDNLELMVWCIWGFLAINPLVRQFSKHRQKGWI